MSSYDKRRKFKLYSDGRNYILTSQHIENEKLLIRLTQQDKLYLNKITQNEFQTILANSSRPYVNVCESYGCIGLFKLLKDNARTDDIRRHKYYLIFIKDAQSVNSIGKSDILRISDVFVVYLNNFNPEEDFMQYINGINNSNSYFIEIRKFLSSGYFYFSYSNDYDNKYDLTLNSQLRYLLQQTNQNNYKGIKCDNRFLWNSTLLTPFRRFCVDINNWFTNIICGYVEIKKVIIGHEAYKACLISRLSSERAGTRFNCRGTNDYGHCANYVETEQLIINENMDEISSIIQIRGSIPLFWEQTGLQVGTHRIKITRGLEACYSAFERHFKFLIKNFYEQVLILNLLGRKGDEAILSDFYKRLYNSCDLKENLNFISFDYHQELKSNKQALNEYLLPKLLNYLSLKSFKLNFDLKSQALQNFVIRTNCLDCLDRTNATQTFIGLHLLKSQLAQFNLSNFDKNLSKFNEVFKQMWVTNGDNLSKIYAGTGAIQGKSVTQDIGRSLSRAIQNNFLDQIKQDIIEAFLYGAALIKGSDLAERSRILLTSSCLQLPSYILVDMIGRYKEYCETKTCNIVVGTWNINGGLYDLDMDKLNLYEWLCEGPLDHTRQDEIDVYAVGFQEIVDLNASNIVNASDANASIWYDKINKFLKSTNLDYIPITAEPVQMVGVCLFLFVHKKHASFIRDVAVSRNKTGLGGAAGNKGGVSIRFTYYNSSICFVCSHFAAHQKQIKERNDDFRQIYENTEFPQSRDMKSHDYVIWFGDLNYRIDLPNDYVRTLINDCNWDELLKYEQLTLQRRDGNVFQEFSEAPLCFPPTYKYNLHEDSYDRSEKCRIPAWTDRILWRRRRITKSEMNDKNYNAGKCLYYGRGDIRYSDHRPVCALLQLEVNKVIPKRLFNVFEQVLRTTGPFQGTIIVSIVNGVLSRQLQNTVVDLFSKFHENFVFREFHGCLYFTYFIFQEAIETCLKFNNFHMFDQNCYLNCKLEYDNYHYLAQEEINFLMHTHLPIFDDKLMETQNEDLLGDYLYDEQSFIQVPSQIHTNLSVSKNLHAIHQVTSQNYLHDDDHNLNANSKDSRQFYKSLSFSSLPVDTSSYGSGSIASNDYTSTKAAEFHLFDLPNDGFEKISIVAPRRPPPPPPPQSKANYEAPLISITQDDDDDDNYLNAPQASHHYHTPSPPPPELHMNLNKVHFSKTVPEFTENYTKKADPIQLIHIYENVEQTQLPPPLPPIPQPRTKFNQKQSDLLLLGDPGSPVTLLPTKPPVSFQLHPLEPNTDFDLLGDPGSPPPTPPPL